MTAIYSTLIVIIFCHTVQIDVFLSCRNKKCQIYIVFFIDTEIRVDTVALFLVLLTATVVLRESESLFLKFISSILDGF